MARMSAALRHLSAADPALAALIGRVGPCRITVEPREPYEALVRAISHQQLHARAAEAILGRFIALYPGPGFPSPEAVLGTPDTALRACGLSGSKGAAIRDIATNALNGTIPSAAEAAALDDATLIERLIRIRGVGRWTVEMLLIFTLGRPDVLPVDDYGVRNGWRVIQNLPVQPRPRDLAVIGEAWAPFRSTAAWFLWRASDERKKARPAPSPVVVP
jgi:DNA-3-methyladenine glycosylase II